MALNEAKDKITGINSTDGAINVFQNTGKDRIKPATLAEKVLDFIDSHPDGVRISEMEKPLGETRMKLGFIAKSLLEEGRVLKIEALYFPKNRHEG